MKIKNKKIVPFGTKLFIIQMVCFLGILFFVAPETSAYSDTSDLMQLTNEIRLQNNLPELKESGKLTQAALSRVQDMVQKNYFSHKSPEGKSFVNELEKVDYYFKSAGENLAIDFYENRKLLDAWMKSETHRQNLLNPEFSEMGIAKFGNIVVQILASPSEQKNGFYLFTDNQDKGQVLGAYISSKNSNLYLYLFLGIVILTIPYLILKK